MKMTPADLPNLKSLLRFQQQVYAGGFTPNELEDLFSSSTVDMQAVAMHSDCGEIFQKYRKSVADNAPSRKMYMKNIFCVGIATCPMEMGTWYSCIRAAKENNVGTARMPNVGTGASHCQKFKRMVERCGRETSQKMLRASLDDLFQSKHG
jgi:hypothetical protein